MLVTRISSWVGKFQPPPEGQLADNDCCGIVAFHSQDNDFIRTGDGPRQVVLEGLRLCDFIAGNRLVHLR